MNMKFLIPASLTIVTAVLLSSCGGGGGGGSDEDETVTIRPKTMDGIVLRLDSEVEFEFISNLGAPAAINSGDEERGAFIYKPLFDFVVAVDETRNEHRNYENLAGSKTLLAFPSSIAVANYTYRAINEASAVLTLTATGADSTHFGHLIPFIEDSAGFSSNVVQINLTFSSNGTSVSSDIVTMSLPTSPFVNSLDTMRLPSFVSLAAGGLVPVNYNPVIDPQRPSKITPASLSGKVMSAKNSIPDSTKDFTISFVADASKLSLVGSTSGPDEIGYGIISVYDPTSFALKPVAQALDYTWRRIGGTDTAELIISGIPDDALLPFDISLNGIYTITFVGLDNGNYAGTADIDTLNAADVTGRFSLLK